MVSAHTHTDVALGEGKRQGGLWLAAGPEPEFPLWLGLISLPLTFLGDPCWFPPHTHSGLRATEERDTTGLGAGGRVPGKSRPWRTRPGALGFLPSLCPSPSVAVTSTYSRRNRALTTVFFPQSLHQRAVLILLLSYWQRARLRLRERASKQLEVPVPPHFPLLFQAPNPLCFSPPLWAYNPLLKFLERI